MKVVYVPGLEDALKRIIGENAAVLVDGKIAESVLPDGVAMVGDLERLRFSTSPKFLWNLGEATVPTPNSDGWVASPIAAEGVTVLEVASGGIAAKIVPASGRIFASTVAETFTEGEYHDLGGTVRRTVAAEMIASLGLKATGEEELKSFMRTAVHVGTGSQSTITLTGLDPQKNYDIHYVSGTDAGKESGFLLVTGGYAGNPRVQYKNRSSANGWTDGDASTAVTSPAGGAFAVRVSNVRPNASKQIVFTVRGATANVIAVAEYEVMAHVSDIGGTAANVPAAKVETLGGVKILSNDAVAVGNRNYGHVQNDGDVRLRVLPARVAGGAHWAGVVNAYTSYLPNGNFGDTDVYTGAVVNQLHKAMDERVTAIEEAQAAIDAALDEINGEEV